MHRVGSRSFDGRKEFAKSASVWCAGDLGDFPRRGQPGCPLERLPGNPPARHAVVLRLQLYGADESRAARSFVAAGSGEAREGGPSYEGRIIRPGDHSPEAMREKASFVLGAMEQRMAALGFSWADVTATQVYTIFEIHPLLADEFVRRGAMSGGLAWHFARPPVQGLDFEVDVRGCRPRIGHLTHAPIIKIPPQAKRVLTFGPPQVVPLSPAEPLSIAVARLAKGGSSQSGTTSSNPPSSSGE